jgi:hypothetical protein
MRVETIRDSGSDRWVVGPGLQAYALGIAYGFCPYFGLSISRLEGLATKTLNLEMLIERRDTFAGTECAWDLRTSSGAGASSNGGDMP